MKRLLSIGMILAALVPASSRCEDWLDRVDEKLTLTAVDDKVRVRFSGLLDLEYYRFDGTAPGLIFTEGHDLFSPRLSLFTDIQLGSSLYLFAQARLDRGFDPADEPLQIRLDEYALRWTPWQDGRLNVQAGRFATVVGNYAARHLSWDNPFVTAPLVYEQVTSIYDSEAPPSAEAFAEGIVEEKYDYNPFIWGPAYATGLSVAGRIGQFDYAAEIKNASLSSRPESWDATDSGFDHPTFSARLGWRPDVAWNLGVSFSHGAYFTEQAASGLPPGTSVDDFKQTVLAQDLSFAWRHWQIWGEVFEARFEVPYAGKADLLGYYLEAKYKFSPRWFAAVRWNQMLFDEIPAGGSGFQPWGHDVWRIDGALTWRLTAHAQWKVQYSLADEKDGGEGLSNLLATQFTIRF